MKKRIIIALGGNAIQNKGERGTYEEQYMNVYKTMQQIMPLFRDKSNEIVITHGNGPQVGNILIQNNAGKDLVPEMPMFVCGAMSQGFIGFLIQKAIKNLFIQEKLDIEVATVLTQVEVDPKDKAFENPSKPVGPFYEKEESDEIAKKMNYIIKEDSGRGYRRVVPSPEPIDIVELEFIRESLEAGNLVICSGGGGIPVLKKDCQIDGIDAVIDKDRAASLLGDKVNADLLIILTAVEKVCLNFGGKDEKTLDEVNLKDLRKYLDESHFAEGSMKPKIEAIIKFIEKNKNRQALITKPDKLTEALEKKNGTWINY